MRTSQTRGLRHETQLQLTFHISQLVTDLVTVAGNSRLEPSSGWLARTSSTIFAPIERLSALWQTALEVNISKRQYAQLVCCDLSEHIKKKSKERGGLESYARLRA